MTNKETYPTPSLAEILTDATTADRIRIELFERVVAVVTLVSRERGFYTFDTDLSTGRKIAAIALEYGMRGKLFDGDAFANPIELQSDPIFRSSQL